MAFPDPPTLGACLLPPPELPDPWYGVALCTPFDGAQPVVVEAFCNWQAGGMRLRLWGVAAGQAELMVRRGDGEETWVYWRCHETEPWQGPWNAWPSWQIPAPTLVAERKGRCVGTQDVITTPCEWWVGMTPCTNPCADPRSPREPVGNWLWFREDDRLPFRWMFINQANPYQIPYLGEFALVHWPTFRAATNDEVTRAAAEALEVKTAAAAPAPGSPLRDPGAWLCGKHSTLPTDLIPGLCAPDGAPPLPTWPETLFMTALTIPTAAPQVLGTQIFYDWPIRRMLTRLWQPPEGDWAWDDLVLTDSLTYDISRNPDGSYHCNGKEPPGLPYPDWPKRDRGRVMAQIVNNPALSPGRTTQLIVLPSDHGRVFWIWYTTDSRAVMFTEVPQLCDVGLVLIDYFAYQANPVIPPDYFAIPPACG